MESCGHEAIDYKWTHERYVLFGNCINYNTNIYISQFKS